MIVDRRAFRVPLWSLAHEVVFVDVTPLQLRPVRLTG